MNSEINSSDKELRQQVYQAIAAIDQLRKCKLRVGVANGFVHLGGKLSSLDLYVQTEELVRNLAGVRGVINRIEAPGAPSPSRVIHLDAISTTNQTHQLIKARGEKE
mgnify:CR=1 FL=1